MSLRRFAAYGLLCGGWLAGGCHANHEIPIEEVVAALCACAERAASETELEACTDDSSDYGAAARAYRESLQARGLDREELFEDPHIARAAQCMLAAAHERRSY